MWDQPKFDDHAFAGRKSKAVSATKTADDWDSTGISFQDFGGMHVKKIKVRQVRKLQTPEWTLNDEMVRAVILRLGENRLFIADRSGNDQERLARIKAAAENALPAKRQRLERQMADYAAYQEQKDNKDYARILRSFAIQIQALDSEIMMLQGARFVSLATAIVYRYYRQGHDSVQIAEEFGIKSPMIRIWASRMNTVACQLGFPCSVSRMSNKHYRPSRQALGMFSSVKLWDNKKVMELFALRTGGASVATCAKVLSVPDYVVILAWRHYFGDLKVRVRTSDKRTVTRTLRPLKAKGMSEFRVRVVNRLRTLFILRTSGKAKTWAECARALGTTRTSARLLWKHHFGDLNPSKKKVKRMMPKRPRRPVWTAEKLLELKSLRESGKTFRECAETMGLKRGQQAQSAYVRYVVREQNIKARHAPHLAQP